jgi:hypothetical protein
MPNPRITVRVPKTIYEQLPTNADERSAFVLAAIQTKLNPPTPEDELSQLRRRVERLEQRLAQ